MEILILPFQFLYLLFKPQISNLTIHNDHRLTIKIRPVFSLTVQFKWVYPKFSNFSLPGATGTPSLLQTQFAKISSVMGAPFHKLGFSAPFSGSYDDLGLEPNLIFSMAVRAPKQKRKFVLGYTRWRNLIKIWFLSMFDQQKWG